MLRTHSSVHAKSKRHAPLVIFAGALVTPVCAAVSTAQCPTLVAPPPGMTTAFQEVAIPMSVLTDVRPLKDCLSQGGFGGGPGAVFTDLNNDGYPDIYLMRGDPNGNGTWSENQLYMNVADGVTGRKFQQLPELAGAADPSESAGAVAADYDNDGDADILVLNYDDPNVLLRNMWMETGSPADPMALTFTDVTGVAGVAEEMMATGDAACPVITLDKSVTAAFGDVNRDGFADLFIGNHNGSTAVHTNPDCPAPGMRDIFYLSNGDGTFADVTEVYGVTGYEWIDGTPVAPCGHIYSSAAGSLFADVNNDRWPDLIVLNNVHDDCDRTILYLNQGEDAEGVWLGFDMVTYDLDFGDETKRAMGIDAGDYDNDGDLDLYATDSTAYVNDLWVNQLAETGSLGFVHCESLPAVMSWGTQWQDFDNNGWLDVHAATQRDLRDHLYMNMGGGVFYEAGIELGVSQCPDESCENTPNSRTSVTADLNRDGFVDILVANRSAKPSIFENEFAAIAPANHFLELTLKGDPAASGDHKSTRDALGARVRISADLDGDGSIGPNETIMREVRAGSSNTASCASLALEFGLGLSDTARIETLWPSGARYTAILDADQLLIFDETYHRLGDLNADGVIVADDLAQLIGQWGPCPAGPTVCPADLDDDGVVNAADLAALIGSWGG